MIKNYSKKLIGFILLSVLVSGCATTGKKGSKGFKHDTPLIKTDVKTMGKKELDKKLSKAKNIILAGELYFLTKERERYGDTISGLGDKSKRKNLRLGVFDVVISDADADTNNYGYIQLKNIEWTATGTFPSSGDGASYAVLMDNAGGSADATGNKVIAWFDLGGERTLSSGQKLSLQDLEIRLT